LSGSYEQILRERGPLPVDEVVALGIAVGSALHAAHQAGLDHGDVRPSTIPLDGDFAAVPGPASTGLAAHASPEALLGQAQSALSDVYSLASSLWTLLTGHPPFLPAGGAPPDRVAFRDRVLHDPLPPMRPDVPDWLTAELTRALAKRPAQRHPSAQDFADALRRAGAPAPVGAPSPVGAPAVVPALVAPRLLPATPPPGDPDISGLDQAGWQGLAVEPATRAERTAREQGERREPATEPPTARPAGERPRRIGRVVLAAAAGLIAVAAAVSVAAVAATNRPVRPAPVASASVITPVANGAPGEVRLTDNGAAITVSWTDPTHGAVEFLVTGAPVGGPPLPLRNLARGMSSVTYGGLDPRANYCFVVAAVYAVDRVATAPRACTTR
jgi:hypothetical protein